jgi:predicted Zn-dependent protease
VRAPLSRRRAPAPSTPCARSPQVGLLLASRACYDPYHAQYLFHEFARERKEGKMGAQPSAALSTHPLDEVREAAMRTQISKGMAERRRCACPPVDMRKREKLDRTLKAMPIRRLSCIEQDPVPMPQSKPAQA